MKTANFIGTCVNCFDEDGDCVIRGLYNDINDFAVHEENADNISKAEFTDAVGWVDEELCKSIGRKREYQSDGGRVYMIYDVKADVHYFFAPLSVGVLRNPGNDVPKLIAKMISEYNRTPYQINNGDCDIFAKSLKRRIPSLQDWQIENWKDHALHVLKLSTVARKTGISLKVLEELNLDHAWVYDRKSKKNYDAESPDGVEDPILLMYFQRKLASATVKRNPTYQITKRQLSNAKSLNVTIKPSTNPKKKLDVFQSQHKLCSIGATGYMDYDLYLADGDKQLADKRRKLYKSRHESDRHRVGSPGFFADKILW